MKKILFIALVISAGIVYAKNKQSQNGYVLEHERDLKKTEAGPHNGGGTTNGYNYFSKAENFHTAFRKRVLYKGSSIGWHTQKEDEIYYIVSGTGEMKMNNEILQVISGDGILTRIGSSHSLKPTSDSLVLIITYPTK
jgi:mannose-6-phosphate isomerase-like protein (cupin superfamily)